MTTRRATFRWWVAGLWLALLVSSTPGLEVRGGEPAASDGGGLGGRELRIFDVSSLTVGFPDFECGDGPGAEVVARAPARPDGAKPAPVPPLDRPDPRPAFGGEREEWIRPFGTLDDVVEFLKRVHREALTVEGVRLYPIGGDRLVLVGPRALADAVASSLDDLERAYARFATIDVLALRGDVGRFADGDLGAALACGGLVPLAGARGVGPAGRSPRSSEATRPTWRGRTRRWTCARRRSTRSSGSRATDSRSRRGSARWEAIAFRSISMPGGRVPAPRCGTMWV